MIAYKRKNLFVTGMIAVSFVLLAGCAGSKDAAQAETEVEQSTEAVLVAMK